MRYHYTTHKVRHGLATFVICMLFLSHSHGIDWLNDACNGISSSFSDTIKTMGLFHEDNNMQELLSIVPLDGSHGVSEQELSLNCAYVSPTTFRHFFSFMDEFGYVCRKDAYLIYQALDEKEKRHPFDGGVICLKSHSSLKDTDIAANDFIKNIAFKPSEKSAYFLPIQYENLKKLTALSVTLNEVVFNNPREIEEITFYNNVLKREFLKKFQNIPLMDQMIFEFVQEELQECLPIKTIRFFIEGYKHHLYYLDTSTSLVIKTRRDLTTIKLNHLAAPRENFDDVTDRKGVCKKGFPDGFVSLIATVNLHKGTSVTNVFPDEENKNCCVS